MLLWVLILKHICWLKNVVLTEILKNVKPWLYNMQISSVERTSARSKHWLVSHWSAFKWVLKQDMIRFVRASLQWDLFQYLLCATPGYHERSNSTGERKVPCWSYHWGQLWFCLCTFTSCLLRQSNFLLLSPHPAPYPISTSLSCRSCQPASVILHYMGSPMLQMWPDITYQLISQKKR